MVDNLLNKWFNLSASSAYSYELTSIRKAEVLNAAAVGQLLTSSYSFASYPSRKDTLFRSPLLIVPVKRINDNPSYKGELWVG